MGLKEFIFLFWLFVFAGRLVRYLHPTDDDLKAAAGIQSTGGGKGHSGGNKGARHRKHEGKKGSNHREKDDTFTIPCNTPVALDVALVEPIDLVHLNYYEEYIWLMDYSLCAVVVYILTEIYFVLGNWNEMNISLLWCLLAIAFCVRILLSQTGLYFQTEDGGERVLIITFGFFYLVLAMGILVVDEKILEFGLESGYENFSESALQFLAEQGNSSSGPVSVLTFKIILAFLCSLIGGLLCFPGLRTAKLHLDCLRYSQENRFKQLLLHLNFVLPLFIALTWVKPIARDMLCGLNWRVTTTVLPEWAFENLRIFLFVILFLVRLLLMPTYLQSHLNLAHEKIQKMQKESGRISNIEIQKMVARVFYILCLVTLQYLVPVVILLFLAFLYKTLGDYSWSGMFGEVAENFVSSFTKVQNVSAPANATVGSETIVDKAVQFSLTFSNLRKVFTPVWYRGLLSFISWWVCTSWSISMGFGLYYHSRLSQ